MTLCAVSSSSFRAINSEEDLLPGETAVESESAPEIPLTYSSELAQLNAAYQIEVDKFNRAFAVAYLSDGPSQESKQAAIRAQYEVRKTQHANDVIDLKIKYGV